MLRPTVIASARREIIAVLREATAGMRARDAGLASW